jgi:hypothetical protein
MLLLLLLLWALSTLLDPPWINAPPWKPLVARRTLVLRVIVSPISVPCQARESIVVVRRTLVISPESSHHRYEAVLVLVRDRMCGHLPLIYFAYVKKPTRLTSAFLMNRSTSFCPWCYFHLLANAACIFGFMRFRLPSIQWSLIGLASQLRV